MHLWGIQGRYINPWRGNFAAEIAAGAADYVGVEVFAAALHVSAWTGVDPGCGAGFWCPIVKGGVRTIPAISNLRIDLWPPAQLNPI